MRYLFSIFVAFCDSWSIQRHILHQNDHVSETALDATPRQTGVGRYKANSINESETVDGGICIFDESERDGSDRLFWGRTQIYIAHADSPHMIIRNFRNVPNQYLNPHMYATVVGSMSGLNGLLTLKEIEAVYFFDVNPYALEYGKLFVDLIVVSKTRTEFLEAIYGRKLDLYLRGVLADSNILDQPPNFYSI